MRLIFTLALTSLFAVSCAPKKAEIVDEPVIKPTRKTEGSPAMADATPPVPVRVNTNSGMKLPPVANQLPSSKDFQPTAPVQATADRGPNLVVPAPKPANE